MIFPPRFPQTYRLHGVKLDVRANNQNILSDYSCAIANNNNNNNNNGWLVDALLASSFKNLNNTYKIIQILLSHSSHAYGKFETKRM